MLRRKFQRVMYVLIVSFIFLAQANATMVYQYNMGPAAGVTGYTDIGKTVYNATSGFGWTYRITNGVVDEYNALFRTRTGNSDPLLTTVILDNRTTIGQPATDSRAYTLRFDVPNGTYKVAIRSGDQNVASDSTFAVGDVVYSGTPNYGDFLKLDDPSLMVFNSGLVAIGQHPVVTSGEFTVTKGYLYVGWGRKLGTIQWGTINDIVITQVPEPATIGLLVLGGIALCRKRFK